nr:MAG TPA: hypothetical protein [Caudoviricetes sp.]
MYIKPMFLRGNFYNTHFRYIYISFSCNNKKYISKEK